MDPFLRLVAVSELEHELTALTDTCYVFPNKRSATFFRHHLGREAAARGIGALVMPDVTTIDALTRRLSPGLAEAGRYDALFTLYRIYCDLAGSAGAAARFDRFCFWGDMLLNDFDEVDRNLVDPEALYVNLRRYKEISSTYLTEEQREIIRTYWDDDLPEVDIDSFWKHTTGNDSDPGDGPERKFLKLWTMMQPLYKGLTERLAEKGLATAGHFYRLAAERIRRDGAAALPRAERYVFVGFYALTTAEISLFDRLRDLGIADFYWDAPAAMLADTSDPSTRLLRRNIERFPSRHPLPTAALAEKSATIEIVGIPSATGQAKYAGETLARWAGEGAIDPVAINTAVVLPDESMLTPLIHAIPPSVADVNVTMGLPMRLTPVASLIRNIVSLQIRAEADSDHAFFHEDIRAVIAHPLLRRAALDECEKLAAEMDLCRLTRLSGAEIAAIAPALAPVFDMRADHGGSLPRGLDTVTRYITGLLDFIDRGLSTPSDSETAPRPVATVAYREALESLVTAATDHDIAMDPSTALRLIETAVGSATVNFDGKPLHGLQIMGVLETRALDFDRVIMMSMNERIFPRRHMAGSFIPEALRRGYGLPTADRREATFSYYFHRLLSRARHVVLLYDSRTVGTRSSEMSRYLTRLIYLPPASAAVSHKAVGYRPAATPSRELSVDKTERVMAILDEFRPGGARRLSPSSINAYINCPLSFYLSEVEGLRVDDLPTDFIDYSTYGQILHRVCEELYLSIPRRDPATGHIAVTAADIEGFLNSSVTLDRLIRHAVNDLYRGATRRILSRAGVKNVDELDESARHALADELDRPLKGDSYALAKLMRMSIREMLRHEKTLTPFTFVGAEVPTNTVLTLPGDIAVNYRQVIDRVDITRDGIHRVVDYKTGSDPLAFKSVDALFDTSSSNVRPKAILQLMLYCIVYARLTGYSGPIQPLIYSTRSMQADGLVPITGPGGIVMTDYHPYADDFLTYLSDVIAEMFNPEIPFSPPADPHACRFCNFRPICGREKD